MLDADACDDKQQGQCQLQRLHHTDARLASTTLGLQDKLYEFITPKGLVQ